MFRNCVEIVWIVGTVIWDKSRDGLTRFLPSLILSFFCLFSCTLYFSETNWRFYIPLLWLLCYLSFQRQLRCDWHVDKNPVRSLPTVIVLSWEEKRENPVYQLWVAVFSKANPSKRLDQISSNFVLLLLHVLIVHDVSWILYYDFNWHINQYN